MRQEEKQTTWREVNAKRASKKKRPRDGQDLNGEGKKNKVEGESSVEMVAETVEAVVDASVPVDAPVVPEPTMEVSVILLVSRTDC